MNRLDGAPSLPIKSEIDLAIDARAAEILRDYDVSPEEAGAMARGEIMQNLDNMGGVNAESALARAHQDAGKPKDQARRLAAEQVRIYGENGAGGLAQEYTTPAGMARLVRATQEGAAADARHQKMQDDYYRDTNAPGHQQVSPETQQAWDQSERYSREQGRLIRAGLHPQTPVDAGTPEQNASWERFLEANPDEMARYRPEVAAEREAAQRDKDMEAVFLDIRQKYGPDEEAKARAARANGRTYVPQTAAQATRNENARADQYSAMKGDKDARTRLIERDERRQPYVRARQLREVGLPTDTPESTASDAKIRQLLADKRKEDKQSKDLLWKPRSMIRGGNAIGAAALPGMGDWQHQMLAGGPTPLDVQARNAAMAAQMAQQAVTGFLANNPTMTAAQRELADLKARAEEENLPPDAAADRERNRNDGSLPASSRAGQRVLQQIDTDVVGPFATDSELETAVQEAKRRGIPEEDARRYFDRRRSDVFFFGARPGSKPGPVSYDAMPPGG